MDPVIWRCGPEDATGVGYRRRRAATTVPSMGIVWDPVLAGATARALDEALRGLRARALHLDPAARRLNLFLDRARLLVLLHPQEGGLVLLPPSDPFPEARPLASRLIRVSALPDDRVLLLELRRLRRPGTRTLVLEWIPTRWNAFLLDGTPGDDPPPVVRQVLATRRGGDRPTGVGSRWYPPPASPRMGASAPVELPRVAALLDRGREDPGAVLAALAWTSSLNLPWLLEVPGEEAVRRWTLLRDAGLGRSPPTPGLVPREGGWTPYPLPLPGSVPPATPDLLEAFEQAVGGSAGGRSGTFPPSLAAALERALRGARGRLRGLRRELERAPDPTPLRTGGDLLLARFREIPRGAEQVVLTDFDGRPVRIPLDPALPPQENAARLYREAARAERARESLPSRIRAAEVRIAELEELETDLGRGAPVDPERVAALLSEGSPGGRGPAAAPPALPYRRYRSSGGLEIRVGRGARLNDELTFRHSARDDVWLHARQAAGAHVILRWPGPGNPPRRDLEEAATLAALHSRARTSGSVPVDWTLRRYVRKPRGAPPGRVVPERVRTLFVEPDPEVERRLRQEDGPVPHTPE